MQQVAQLLVFEVDVVLDHQNENKDFHRKAKKTHHKAEPVKTHFRVLVDREDHVVDIGKNPQKVVKDQNKEKTCEDSIALNAPTIYFSRPHSPDPGQVRQVYS